MESNRYDPHDQSETPHSSVRGRAVTREEMAYRNGYVQGRSNEQYNRARDRALLNEQRRAEARANDNAASVLILGILIATFAGIFAAIFYFNSRPATPELPAPDINIEVPEAPEAPESNTILERTIERTREVAPNPAEITLPEVNINLPEGDTAPAGEAEPAPAEAEATEPAQ